MSAASSELSSLSLSLSKEACGDEEAESRDMAEAERQLDSSPLEVLSEEAVGGLGVAVLSSAATFCCGGQDVASKAKTELLNTVDTEKSNSSQTAGTNVSQCLRDRCSISTLIFFSCLFQHLTDLQSVLGV